MAQFNTNLADFKIVANDNYIASIYEAPGVFVQVGSTVEKIVVGRDIHSPNSILAFVTGDRSEQVEYIEGLVGIGVFLCCLVSIWLITLLLLKCQGRERVGCAAGFGFHDSESDKESLAVQERGSREDESVGAAVGDDDSVAMDEPALRVNRRKSKEPKPSRLSSRLSSILGSFQSSQRRSGSKDELGSGPPKVQRKPNQSWTAFQDNNFANENVRYDIQNTEEIELHMELDNIVRSATRDSELGAKGKRSKETWALRSLPTKEVIIGDETEDESSVGRHVNDKLWGQTCCCSLKPKHVARRKVQTRLVFALFAILSLVSCVLLITHMYLPLESAAFTSGAVVQETAQIVDEINEVLVVVDEAASVSVTLLETTPLQYQVICPNFPVADFQAQFGFNPNTLINTVSAEYQNYIPTIVDLLNTAKETGASVTSVLADINSAVSTTNEYLWIIPLIICVTMLIIFSQLALMAAVSYKEYKFKGAKTTVPKVENCYGWTVLPLQIFVTLLSWILVIAFCFGIIVTTDSCMPSFSTIVSEPTMGARGTPEDTVLAVLDQYIVADQTASLIDNLAYQRLSTYVTGCREDPLQELVVVQGLLEESLEYVNTQVSFANDVLGLEFIQGQCGASNQVELFFDNLSVLNAQLFEVNKAIKNAYDAVSCPRVNALYVEAVHGALCTDFATSNTNGLLLLIVISFSGMIMITLRAAWRSAE